uniref:KH domain-containing protein n=1 Tax=Trichuris muris TaxID=70415 RepID=A0A5S6QPU5_TRIMR
MDVMKPDVYWVGDRCYRKNPVSVRTNTEDDEFESAPMAALSPEELAEMAEFDIKENDRGFTMQLDVASAYYRFIVGHKGDTRRRLEMETATVVEVPKPDAKGFVVITGSERANVASCARRIQLIVGSARSRQPFTHFLSIPFNSDEIKAGFGDFQKRVLLSSDSRGGITDDLFQRADRLHMTIGTLVLMSETERQTAKELLIRCNEEVIRPLLGRSLDETLCSLEGIEYMNDDPGQVDVLYAKVVMPSEDEQERLQTMVDQVCAFFQPCGLMKKELERVKMHVTIMNDLFRERNDQSTMPQTADGESAELGRRVRCPFDARRILKEFGNFRFGVQPSLSLHLSQRYSYGQDGYYLCTSKV